jgi:hypothetical protein
MDLLLFPAKAAPSRRFGDQWIRRRTESRCETSQKDMHLLQMAAARTALVRGETEPPVRHYESAGSDLKHACDHQKKPRFGGALFSEAAP